ncbi:N-acetyltransferase [Bdellovibrio sp. qaytius]|nr:N-acetyltransferase [Bdellovibrio sp. qaytius]
MNIQPHLIGDRLELRALHANDYEPLLKAASDPLIWEQHPQSDRYKPEVFKSFFDEALASNGALVIIDRATNAVIGTTRYYDYSKENSSIIIGYTFLAKTYWGGDFNKELKKLVVNYALKFVKTTYFQVGLNNTRSQKAMEKIGAINTGIQEVVISYGPPKKSYIYKIEKPF